MVFPDRPGSTLGVVSSSGKRNKYTAVFFCDDCVHQADARAEFRSEHASAFHTGHVVETCTDRRTAEELIGFIEKVASKYSGGTVHIIWDNLNIHYDGALGSLDGIQRPAWQPLRLPLNPRRTPPG